MNKPLHWHSRNISGIIVFFFLIVTMGPGTPCAQTGRLTVTSQPSGVMLLLDEVEIGTTPLYDRIVKEGFHVLQLIDPVSKATTTQTVQILADSLVALNVILGNSTNGYLDVESKPQGANVTLVTVLGKTPLHNIPINPGDYSVRIEPPRQFYRGAVQEATILENSREEINVSLPKNKPFIYKTTAKILLGVASIGCYAVGCYADHGSNNALRTTGFVLGTACLVSVEIISFF